MAHSLVIDLTQFSYHINGSTAIAKWLDWANDRSVFRERPNRSLYLGTCAPFPSVEPFRCIGLRSFIARRRASGLPTLTCHSKRRNLSELTVVFASSSRQLPCNAPFAGNGRVEIRYGGSDTTCNTAWRDHGPDGRRCSCRRSHRDGQKPTTIQLLRRLMLRIRKSRDGSVARIRPRFRVFTPTVRSIA